MCILFRLTFAWRLGEEPEPEPGVVVRQEGDTAVEAVDLLPTQYAGAQKRARPCGSFASTQSA
jgi:hypothetical protein